MVKVDTYGVIEDAVRAGMQFALNRAVEVFQSAQSLTESEAYHAGRAKREPLIDEMTHEVVNALCEVLVFDAE